MLAGRRDAGWAPAGSTAAELGVALETLYNMLDRHGLRGASGPTE